MGHKQTEARSHVIVLTLRTAIGRESITKDFLERGSQIRINLSWAFMRNTL